MCVCVCLPGRVCWSAVNDAVMSGSRLSQEKRLTHGLTGWPTFTGTGKWITAERTHTHTYTCTCRGPVAVQYFALRLANISQVQRAVIPWMTDILWGALDSWLKQKLEL